MAYEHLIWATRTQITAPMCSILLQKSVGAATSRQSASKGAKLMGSHVGHTVPVALDQYKGTNPRTPGPMLELAASLFCNSAGEADISNGLPVAVSRVISVVGLPSFTVVLIFLPLGSWGGDVVAVTIPIASNSDTFRCGSARLIECAARELADCDCADCVD